MLNQEKNRIIGIVGPTGAGKSTLAENLGRVLPATVYQEKPQDNPFFEQFYADLHNGVKPSKAVLDSELFFLEAAFDQAIAARESLKTGLVIWDVPIQGHLMYAELLRQQGFLSQMQYEIYLKRYNECLAQIVLPDLFIVATVASTNLEDVAVLVQHMQERGRVEEAGTPIEYWQSQVAYWKTQLEGQQERPHVVVDSSKIDWRTEEGVAQVLQTFLHLI